MREGKAKRAGLQLLRDPDRYSRRTDSRGKWRCPWIQWPEAQQVAEAREAQTLRTQRARAKQQPKNRAPDFGIKFRNK